MKAELKFNLDDPDDKMAHMRCVKALDMALAIWNIKQALEEALDTSEDGLTISGLSLSDRFNDIWSNHNINLEDLIC
jgi:hypothetical protein